MAPRNASPTHIRRRFDLKITYLLRINSVDDRLLVLEQNQPTAFIHAHTERACFPGDIITGQTEPHDQSAGR